jgi:hypothetical protein
LKRCGPTGDAVLGCNNSRNRAFPITDPETGTFGERNHNFPFGMRVSGIPRKFRRLDSGKIRKPHVNFECMAGDASPSVYKLRQHRLGFHIFKGLQVNDNDEFRGGARWNFAFVENQVHARTGALSLCEFHRVGTPIREGKCSEHFRLARFSSECQPLGLKNHPATLAGCFRDCWSCTKPRDGGHSSHQANRSKPAVPHVWSMHILGVAQSRYQYVTIRDLPNPGMSK